MTPQTQGTQLRAHGRWKIHQCPWRRCQTRSASTMQGSTWSPVLGQYRTFRGQEPRKQPKTPHLPVRPDASHPAQSGPMAASRDPALILSFCADGSYPGHSVPPGARLHPPPRVHCGQSLSTERSSLSPCPAPRTRPLPSAQQHPAAGTRCPS